MKGCIQKEISEREKYIKLDITESLIYNILFTKGYSESWKYLNLRSNTYKIKDMVKKEEYTLSYADLINFLKK